MPRSMNDCENSHSMSFEVIVNVTGKMVRQHAANLLSSIMNAKSLRILLQSS